VAIRIEKSFQVGQPAERVWAFLSNPRKMVTCLPGAKITEQVDEHNYKGSISVKVGPSVTDFNGEVQILRSDPQNYEIEILGKGLDVRGRGSASMKMEGKLKALDAGHTEIVSVSELNVVGILAQMGARVITEISNVMFGQFTKNLESRLAEPADAAETAADAENKPLNAGSLAWQAAKGVFRRES
jgi:uncharacterized protein